MAEKRRKFDAEFREGAVRIVTETGLGAFPSMGRAGSCFDNAVSEAFNSVLKADRLRNDHRAGLTEQLAA